MSYSLLLGDAVGWARRYAAKIRCGQDLPLFHALLCDPPYELKFMGRNWDSTGVSFRPETWRAFRRIMLPGAFGMAFSSARGFHRMAVAIEDAGFRIHPMIGWIYGSGFPKATRIDTQIDKAAGAEREVIETRDVGPNIKGDNYHRDQGEREIKDITIPATALAQAWEGHRYGLQALKPALEPIIVFQNPYEGKPLDSIVGTGAGALNIDAGRIRTDPSQDDMLRTTNRKQRESKTWEDGSGFKNEANELTGVREEGRWPANIALTHHPDCRAIGTTDDNYQINRFTDGAKPFGDGAGHEFTSDDIEGKTLVWECVEGCPVRAMNLQSGQLKSGKFADHHKIRSEWGYAGGKRDEKPSSATYGDQGGAARFFHQSEWALEQTDPFLYQAKSAVTEREEGLIHNIPCTECGNLDSTQHINNKGKEERCRRCVHPTVKPIALTQHLAALLLPPDHYAPRNLFIPFAGVASEMIGAYRAGWDNLVGVELQKEYIGIGNPRMKYWIELEIKET